MEMLAEMFQIVERQPQEGDVRQFLSENQNINVNELNHEELSCLHIACQYGQEENVKALLQHPKIEVNIRDSCGESPLIKTISKSYREENVTLKVVSMLLEHPKIDVNHESYSGKRPLHYAMELPNRQTCLKVVTELLKTPYLNVSVTNDKNVPCWAYLFDGSRLSNYFDYFHEEPGSIIEIARLFVNHATMDINQGDDKGKTILMHLSRKRLFSSLVKDILQNPKVKVDLNIFDKEGNTVLHHLLAAKSKSSQIEEWKEELFGDILNLEGVNYNQCNEEGMHILMLAVKKGSKKVTDLILEKPDVEFNIKDKQGNTALLHSKDTDITEKLLSMGEHRKVDINIVNTEGLSKFRDALMTGDKRLADTLQRHPQYNVNHVHSDGLTDLMFAVKQQRKQIDKATIEQYLLKHPQCDISVKGKEGTVLSSAVLSWQIEMLPVLMSHHTYSNELFNVRDTEGKTFLHHLCCYRASAQPQQGHKSTHSNDCKEHMDILKPILEAVCHDVNIQDGKDYTPLMHLVNGSHPLQLEIAEYLLKDPTKCDFTRTNKYHQTVMDIAERVNKDNPIDDRVWSLLNKYAGHTSLSYRSNISIPDQIKFLQNSIDKSPDFELNHKEYLINELKCFSSEVEQFSKEGSSGANQMKQEHRDILRGRRVYLLDNLEMDMLDHLIQDGIINEHTRETITAEKTRKDRVIRFLAVIQTKGPRAYDSLIAALRKTNKAFVADELERYDPDAKNEMMTAGGNGYSMEIVAKKPKLEDLGELFHQMGDCISQMKSASS